MNKIIPYLIQRAKFKNRPDRTGVDSLLSFDYMGSAEFEFGALPKSLKRIRESKQEYVQFQYTFKKFPAKFVTVLCKKDQQEQMEEILEQLLEKEFRLKEYCDLDAHVNPNQYNSFGKYGNDFWWDIDNDFFFWKSNADFDQKFKKALFEV